MNKYQIIMRVAVVALIALFVMIGLLMEGFFADRIIPLFG